MKQIRKVKSLLLKKQLKVSNVLTVLFCVLWWILCWWAVLLLMIKSPTLAADGEGGAELKSLQYSSVDDKVEALERLSFTFTGDDNKVKIVSEMYQSGTTLYVVPKPLIINSPVLPDKNIIWSWVWWNILWWYNNEVDSDNITVVGWKENRVESGNTNSTVLWWIGNVFGGWNDSPSIMVWWEGNRVSGNEWVNVVVWGSTNKVVNTENVNIVWWLNNTVDWWSNVVVWWSNVSVSNGVKNVFVFSDGSSNFSLNNSSQDDTFYLKVQNGLWLNVAWSKKWVESNGAVSFGEIDIDVRNCYSEDLWLEGTRNGCLVGCTRASMNTWNKWEMLDQWEKCTNQCEGNTMCISSKDIEEEHPYTSFCSTWVIWTWNAYMCNPWILSQYKNVIFETALIDSNTTCPNGENKCVYKCNSWYHLTWDVTWKPNTVNSVACYSDCNLPWWGKIKHNEMVTWYNSTEAFCSVDNFNYGTNVGTTHDDCSKHKKKLICSDGVLYIANNSNKATTQTASGAGYTKETCQLRDYRCDTSAGAYNLKLDDITWWMHDDAAWTDSYLTNNDGKRVNWTKWVYKLCVDYDPHSNPNGEKCDDVKPYHFRLVGCQPGYMTWDHHPWECKKKLSLTYNYTRNGWNSFGWLWSNVVQPVTSGSLVDLTTPRAKKTTAAWEWTFVWWNTDADAHVWMTGEYRIPDDYDVTLYAIFSKEITATFKVNGNDSGITLKNPTTWSCVMWNKDTSCTFNGKYDFTVNKTGWIKDGWSKDKTKCYDVEFGVSNTNITISKDTDFYTITHKPLKATFNLNGATKLNPEWDSEKWCNVCNTNTSCSIKTPKIERSGWTPKWWNTNANATVATVSQNTTTDISADTTFYAITEKELTATFNANLTATKNKLAIPSDKRTWTSQKCKLFNTDTQCVAAKTTLVTLPQIQTTEWYAPRWWTLYAWDVKNASDVKAIGSTISLTGDATFYAQVQLASNCNETYTVTYDYATNEWTNLTGWWLSKTNNTVQLAPWSSIDLTPKAEKSWWTFVWWDTDSSSHSKISNKILDDCANVTLYAIFSTWCTVNFKENGAESLAYTWTTCYIYNKEASCKRSAPAIATGVGFSVVGFSTGATNHNNIWAVNAGKDVYLDSSKTIHCGGTYYAQTKKDAIKRYITFYANGNKFSYNGTTYTSSWKPNVCTISAVWNGKTQATSCTFTWTVPSIIAPSSTQNIIWWSNWANNHNKQYTPWQTVTLTMTSDMAYYAQTSGLLQRTVTFMSNPDGTCTVQWSPKKLSCNTSTVLYNGATTGVWSCSITSPSFTVVSNYDAIWYHTSSTGNISMWGIWTGKSVSKNDTYYCIAKKRFQDCEFSWTIIKHGSGYISYEESNPCEPCKKHTTICNDGALEGDEPTSITSCTQKTDCEVCPVWYKRDEWKTKKTDCYIEVEAWKYKTNPTWTWVAACPVWKYTEDHRSYYEKADSCSNCETTYPVLQGPYAFTTNGTWVNSCKWECEAWYYFAGYGYGNFYCAECPEWYTSLQWADSYYQCYTEVEAWYYNCKHYDAESRSCPWGTRSIAHKAYYGWFDYACIPCDDIPANAHFIESNSCEWICNPGYEHEYWILCWRKYDNVGSYEGDNKVILGLKERVGGLYWGGFWTYYWGCKVWYRNRIDWASRDYCRSCSSLGSSLGSNEEYPSKTATAYPYKDKNWSDVYQWSYVVSDWCNPICKQGYYRNDSGRCVSCDSNSSFKKPENSHYTSTWACSWECDYWYWPTPDKENVCEPCDAIQYSFQTQTQAIKINGGNFHFNNWSNLFWMGDSVAGWRAVKNIQPECRSACDVWYYYKMNTVNVGDGGTCVKCNNIPEHAIAIGSANSRYSKVIIDNNVEYTVDDNRMPSPYYSEYGFHYSRDEGLCAWQCEDWYKKSWNICIKDRCPAWYYVENGECKECENGYWCDGKNQYICPSDEPYSERCSKEWECFDYAERLRYTDEEYKSIYNEYCMDRAS